MAQHRAKDDAYHHGIVVIAVDASSKQAIERKTCPMMTVKICRGRH